MAGDRGIIPGRRGTANIARRSFAAVALCALCACATGERSRTDMAGAADRLRVIVEFAAPEADGRNDTAPGATAERILLRLDPEVRDTAQSFDMLPAFALEADAETLMRLLRMPEVLSVAPDREVGLLAPFQARETPDARSGDERE